ncbi:MAG: hypothetical protein JWL83_4308 [Actinomycetia bacterium]|nr:hypothetical protein [Actinomycetes bacterium]
MTTFDDIEPRPQRVGEAEVLARLAAVQRGDVYTWSIDDLFAAADVCDHQDIERVRRDDALDDELCAYTVRFVADQLAANWPRYRVHAWDLGAILLRISWAACQASMRETHDHASLARAMIFPERGAYGIVALRSEALLYSKRDEYPEARLTLAEALERLRRFRAELPAAAPGDIEDDLRKLALRSIAEAEEQVYLARSGTMARIGENLLFRWGTGPAFERAAARGRSTERVERDRYRATYTALLDGAHSGEEAMERIRAIRQYGEQPVERTRMSIVTVIWPRQPNIMAARSRLLLIPLCTILERRGFRPLAAPTWQAEREVHVTRFRESYAAAAESFSEDVRAGFAEKSWYSREHLTSLVQLRLHYALLALGDALPVLAEHKSVPPVLRSPTLSVYELTRALVEGNNDGNLIADARARDYINAVNECWDGYEPWLQAHRVLLRRGDEGVAARAAARPWSVHVEDCVWCQDATMH